MVKFVSTFGPFYIAMVNADSVATCLGGFVPHTDLLRTYKAP